MLSSGNLLASAQALRIAWRWSADDRLVLALPLFHLHGLGVELVGTLVAGASAVLLPKFDADAVLDAAAHDGTLFFGVPKMYARLAASSRARGARPSAAVRVRLRAAARHAARDARRMRRTAGAGALRHERDSDERLAPVRRRAPPRQRRLPAARRRAATRRERRDLAARAERHLRLLAAAGGDRGGVERRRVVPHRRPGRDRRRWLCAHRRPREGADHHGRL
jgi:acyl-CoA synthetase (AMP-forming)/AMP-acid ligase II